MSFDEAKNMNICKTCGNAKQWSEFYKSTRTTTGYRNTCKACCAKSAKDRYSKNKTFCGHNQKNIPLPSQERLRQLFEYNQDGTLTRRISRGSRKAGTIENGKLENYGYRRILIDSNHYLMHRVIWRWHYDSEPKFIDHINQERSDNRIENLRAVDKSSNAQHQKLPKNNSSGYFGVSFYKPSGKWKAMICVKSKGINIGYYATPEQAARAYNEKCIELHGEFGKAKVLHNERLLAGQEQNRNEVKLAHIEQ